MTVLRGPSAMRWWAGAARHRGHTVGFVPTMGALHRGHLSLVARSLRENGRTVASIFVNPTQFGRGEDYARYPRRPRADASLLRRAGVHALWTPAARDLYPEGERTRVTVAGLSEALCGRFRPGHFTGVATVVAKLLNVVRPHRLYLGRKDAQQCAVLERLVTDLVYVGTKVVVCGTVREADGLALSSRNAYLSRMERKAAPILYAALRTGAAAIRAGERSPAAVARAVRSVLSRERSFRTQYVEAVDARTLERRARLSGRVLLAAAGFLGRTRLIDNVAVRLPKAGPR